MTEQGAVPMIVMTRSQDHVEAINSTLRKAGHPVHCTWLPDARDLGDALTQLNPEMLIAFIDELGIDLASHHEGQAAERARDAGADRARATSMRRRSPRRCAWARQDVVTLANRSRLQSVATRELRAYRLERALSTHAVLGARVSRTAAEFSRRLGRRHHARAGRHHRRCQPRVARAVRLFGRRCAHRHAAHGFVRAGDASRAQGRAGRVPAGQVDAITA